MRTLKELVVHTMCRNPTTGALYYFMLAARRERFGMAFNGQCVRQLIVLELLHTFQFAAIIETGTFRGSTTYFLVQNSPLPVFSVELNPLFYRYAKHRLRKESRVRVLQGDSRGFLRRLAADSTVPKTPCFFYLDAHWGDDLPLREEIELIVKNWDNPVIMIDDFKVPFDPGYEYDRYRTGKELSLDYLGFAPELGLTAAFPAIPSHLDSGFRRGSIVLTTMAMRNQLETVRSLRTFAWPFAPAETGSARHAEVER